jgi:hypothetical protein
VPQPQVIVQAIARKNGKLVAAGTAILDALAPHQSQSFSGYWIGNPKGAKLTVIAPATAIGGGSAAGS